MDYKNTYPLKKNFEKEFIVNGKKKFSIKYTQATIAEYHEFFALPHEEQFEEIYSIIHKSCPLTLFERLVQYFFPKFPGKIERSLDIQKEVIEIINNKFRTYKSVFTEDDKKAGNKGMLYSAGISILCQKYCIPPHILFENYTLEQYSWLMDGIIYVMNESDEEGRKKNHLAVTDKEAIQKRAEETRKLFEQFENKSNT